MNSKSQKRKDKILNIGVCFSMIVLTLIILVTFTQSAVAAPGRLGAQAVVFPRWNSTSVSNLVSAVNETLPPEFELSQCPFFEKDGSKRWNNTLQFLTGVNSNVGIIGTFFVSFRNDNPSPLLNTDYQWRASNLSSFLIFPQRALGGKSAIEKLRYLVISPQLEDDWNDPLHNDPYGDVLWKAKMKLVLDQLDEEKILKSGKLTLRRSVMYRPTNLNNTIYSYTRGANTYSFLVHVERHGFSSSASWPNNGTMAIWSNDGHFVYYPKVINGITEANDSVNPQVPSYPFNQFLNVRSAFIGSTLLWRPSMNLWRRGVLWGPESSVGKITWYKEADYPAWVRIDNPASPAFDAREKQVMKDYINSYYPYPD
jgi:hypothetical protein